MPIIVIQTCPNCKKPNEYQGKNLEGIKLDTKEGWVMECPYCKEIFGDFHVIDQNESMRNGDCKSPPLERAGTMKCDWCGWDEPKTVKTKVGGHVLNVCKDCLAQRGANAFQD